MSCYAQGFIPILTIYNDGSKMIFYDSLYEKYDSVCEYVQFVKRQSIYKCGKNKNNVFSSSVNILS